MKHLDKILMFLKENKFLEKFNQDTKEWESVEIDISDPEILETLEIMSSEMAITIKREKMRTGLDKIKDEDKN
tara:strand:- start:960 stop:1178 length:219 start_codon:yes stop_codon:yes gene_type:complete